MYKTTRINVLNDNQSFEVNKTWKLTMEMEQMPKILIRAENYYNTTHDKISDFR